MTLYRINSRQIILSFTLIFFFSVAGCQHQDKVLSQSEQGGSTPNLSRPGESAPFAVGSKTIFIHDTSRAYDSVAGATQGVRTLITELWYPILQSTIALDSRKATYGDYVFSDKTIHRRMLTETTFFHLTPESVREGVSQQQIESSIEELFYRERGSYVDAPLADTSQPLPVIVMTHGDAGSRYNMETAAEYLASHGYIVIAPEHTGNSPFSMSGKDPILNDDSESELSQKVEENLQYLDELGVYGTAAGFGQSKIPLNDKESAVDQYVNLDLALVERVNDLRATLIELDKMNSEGMFADRIDLSKIGLMGRSFGGITTLAGLMLEDKFTAGFAVVPPSIPDIRAKVPAHVLAAGDEESVVFSAQESKSIGRLHKPTFLLLGEEDRLILSIYNSFASDFGMTLSSPLNRYPLMKEAFDTAAVPAIYSVVENTNHGSFGVSGPYWWPNLKPNTFEKYFDKGNFYTLLESGDAHRLQSEMALAFFNLTIRGDRNGLVALKHNPWKVHGASIQVHGF